MDFDRSTEDVGNIVEFGHLNLRVPDQPRALMFYVMVLGLSRDPQERTGTDNAWINVGRNQFHLPVGHSAQVLRGTIHLVMPDLAALARRIDSYARRMAGTVFESHVRGDRIELRCPWGNRVVVHAPDVARFGPHRLGMPCLEIDVAAGTAEGIARFYEQVMAQPSKVSEDERGCFARVPMGPHECVLFRESRAPVAPYDGHHIQVSVSDFSGVHSRLQALRLISEESDQHQYRFVRLVDPRDGSPLTEIEHEVRSLRHPLYGRSLLNAGPASREPGTP